MDHPKHYSQAKDVYQYTCPWPMYALDWSKSRQEQESFRLAVGSFIEDNNNKIQVIARTDLLHGQQPRQHDHNSDFTPVAEADCYYPITKVLWEPARTESKTTDLLATAGDILRLWELVDNPHYGSTSNSINSGVRKSPTYFSQRLVKKAELVNMKQTDFCAPLTSFDWNETDPSLVVTSSIDTTCTVWNVETNQAKTQLIAHDSDVYDVGFMHGSADIFASVGADGSVRLFDLRSLEHSTILYESPIPNASKTRSHSPHTNQPQNHGPSPLLRLQFNRTNSNLLATFHMDSSSVQILDIRHPSAPVVELTNSHQSSVNCMNWSPTKSGQIATGGDDTQVLIWDIHDSDRSSSPHQQNPSSKSNQPPLRTIHDPVLAYSAESSINSLSWNTQTRMDKLTPPNQAHTRQDLYDSDTHSLDSTAWLHIPSIAKLTNDEKSSNKPSSLRSHWLQQRQKNNKRDRAVLGCVGLIVLLVLVGTIALWIGSAFIVPQHRYSTTLAQVPRSSSYRFATPTPTL
ncbi:hypothetical protein [Absidia glauca]|uniref:Uncharacterized protein n=1 Tax=Absidia glauca TaxID=4829 RepID=A0A168SSS1_ABSGL|nr:hypothetical protein [Absidia glauca]